MSGEVLDPGTQQQKDPVVDGVAIEDASGLTGDVWTTLEAESAALGLPGLKTQPLAQFLTAAELQKITPEEKRIILNQALLMFEHLYPHLPFKKRLFGDSVDPEENLATVSAQTDALGEMDFHSRVIAAFGIVLDPHTWYGLPAPYRGAVAFLPFQLGFWMDRDRNTHFVVTKVMNAAKDGGLGHPFFSPGAEILRWNSEDTQSFLSRQSLERLPVPWGETKLAHWTRTATVVPLRFCQPPDDTQATFHYIPPGGGATRAIRFPWGVATAMGDHAGFPHAAFSVNVPTAAISSAAVHFVRRHGIVVAEGPSGDSRVSSMPKVFQFQYTEGTAQPEILDPATLRARSKPGARFGYIRILQFGADGLVSSTDDMVHEFQRILRDVMNQNAPDGLILDIRGNPGGDVQAAERMLQMLTAAHIQPIRFHLLNSPAVRKILETLRSEIGNQGGLTPEQKVRLTDAQLQLQQWIDDPDASSAAGDPLTTGHPLTSEDKANEIGQIYRGPCVLLTDGWTYSAADVFAAGFQDHAIGPVIGVDANTGGGGANVWSHGDLLDKLPPVPDLTIEPLPPLSRPLEERASMSLAFRRCLRVAGKNAGQAIEDHGVTADLWASPGSAESLLSGFPGVIGLACELMAAPRHFEIRAVKPAELGEGTINVELETANLERLTFSVNNFGALSSPAKPGETQSFVVPVPANVPQPSRLAVLGSISFPGKDGTDNAMAASLAFDLTAGQAGNA